MSKIKSDLGIGVGLRPTHYSQFLNEIPKSVSWVEVISENFMPWSDGKFRKSFVTLDHIRQQIPVALHGVSLNIGSNDNIDMDYLKRLKLLIDQIQPMIVSDHLSWTGVNGLNMHDLLPIPYTKEALQKISDKVDLVQNFLGRKILLENPSSYLEFENSELSEWDFISELLKKADCDLLLDINNVYVSSVNHNFDPKVYLSNIPQNRLGQVHLAGHSNMDGYLIDTHDTPICEEVWDLYKWSTNHFGLINTMVERDGNIPEWTELEKEILKIGEIRNEK